MQHLHSESEAIWKSSTRVRLYVYALTTTLELVKPSGQEGAQTRTIPMQTQCKIISLCSDVHVLVRRGNVLD